MELSQRSMNNVQLSTRYIGWVGIGWQQRCISRQSLRELDNQNTVFVFVLVLFLAVVIADGRVRSYCAGWRTLAPHKGDDRIPQCLYGKAPTWQLHSIPIAVSGTGHTGKQITAFDAVIHTQQIMHKVPKPSSQTVLGRMQPTIYATRQTPHGASNLLQAMSPWSVKTRRVPSRHCRDARVYSHACHEYTSPPLR